MSRSNFFSFLRLIPLGLLVALLVACRGTVPLESVDLGQPGWRTRQGEALWHPARGSSPELAGEILAAQNTGGQTFIQFSKPPFPIISAQQTAQTWQIHSPTENRRWAGRGQPPSGIIWFQVVLAAEGRLAAPWQCERREDAMLLKNGRTGEWLRIVWTP